MSSLCGPTDGQLDEAARRKKCDALTQHAAAVPSLAHLLQRLDAKRDMDHDEGASPEKSRASVRKNSQTFVMTTAALQS